MNGIFAYTEIILSVILFIWSIIGLAVQYRCKETSRLKVIWPVITFCLCAAGLISLLTSSIQERTLLDLSARTEALSSQLEDAASGLDRIQLVLEEQIEPVDQLKEEAENAKTMINRSKEQVQAAQDAIEIEIWKNGRQNYLAVSLYTFIIMLIGALISAITPKLIKRHKNKRASKTEEQVLAEQTISREASNDGP